MAQPLSSQDVQNAVDAYFGPQESLSFVSIEGETNNTVDMASPLNKITALSFVNKTLPTFPSDGLCNLRELDFLACQISQPLDLNVLTALRVLKLAETSNVLVHTAPNLTHLQMRNSIHFSNNQKDLIVLPASVADVTLEIGDKFFVESVAHCTGLTALSLIRAYYGSADIIPLSIPDAIFNNPCLTKLSLSWDRLTDIPESVYTNTNLVSLTMSRIGFTTIPITLSQATSLTDLSICPYPHSPYLPFFYLEDITAIWQLTNLRSLCLRAVKMEATVPLKSLPHLKELDIEEAQIGWISSFPKVKKLTLRIKTVAIDLLVAKINQLPLLKHLTIFSPYEIQNFDLQKLHRLSLLKSLYLFEFSSQDLSPLYSSENLLDLRIRTYNHTQKDIDYLNGVMNRNRMKRTKLQQLA